MSVSVGVGPTSMPHGQHHASVGTASWSTTYHANLLKRAIRAVLPVPDSKWGIHFISLHDFNKRYGSDQHTPTIIMVNDARAMVNWPTMGDSFVIATATVGETTLGDEFNVEFEEDM